MQKSMNFSRSSQYTLGGNWFLWKCVFFLDNGNNFISILYPCNCPGGLAILRICLVDIYLCITDDMVER